MEIKGFDVDKWSENSWEFYQANNMKVYLDEYSSINVYQSSSNIKFSAYSKVVEVNTLDDYKKANNKKFHLTVDIDLIKHNLNSLSYEEKKVFLNNSLILSHIPHAHSFYSFSASYLDLLFNSLTVKDSLDVLSKFPITILKIRTDELDSIASFIDKKEPNYDSSEFFYGLIKNRKNQIKAENAKTHVVTFINNRYKDDENLIKKFETIFPYLKEVNGYKNNEIYENLSDDCVVLTYNLENVQKKYSELSMAISGYEILTLKIFEEIGNVYKSLNVNVAKKNPNDSKDYKRICYMHGVSNEHKQMIANVFEKCLYDMVNMKNKEQLFNADAVLNSIVLKNIIDMTAPINNNSAKTKKL